MERRVRSCGLRWCLLRVSCGAVPEVSWQREASGDGRGVVEAVDSLAHAVLGHLQSGQGRPRASARKGRSCGPSHNHMKQGAQRCQRNTSTLRKRLLRGALRLGSTGCVTFPPRCPLCAAVTLVSTRSSVPEEASCSCGRLCEDGRKNDTERLFLISCTIKARDALARSSHSWFSKAL